MWHTIQLAGGCQVAGILRLGRIHLLSAALPVLFVQTTRMYACLRKQALSVIGHGIQIPVCRAENVLKFACERANRGLARTGERAVFKHRPRF